jgi:hypothetical protein
VAGEALRQLPIPAEEAAEEGEGQPSGPRRPAEGLLEQREVGMGVPPPAQGPERPGQEWERVQEGDWRPELGGGDVPWTE